MIESPCKIGSAKELDKFKKSILDEKKKNASKKRILLCAGAGCIASGSLRLKKALVEKIREEKLDAVKKALEEKKPNQVVTITLQRGDEKTEVKVTLGTRRVRLDE